MQEAVVFLVVVLAAMMVAKRYGPKALREGVVSLQVRALRLLGLHKQAARLHRKTFGGSAGTVNLEDLKKSLRQKK